jgi:hypothetical protein
MNTTTDLAVFLWPAPRLFSLQLPLQQRLGLIFVFSIGCLQVSLYQIIENLILTCAVGPVPQALPEYGIYRLTTTNLETYSITWPSFMYSAALTAIWVYYAAHCRKFAFYSHPFQAKQQQHLILQHGGNQTQIRQPLQDANYQETSWERKHMILKKVFDGDQMKMTSCKEMLAVTRGRSASKSCLMRARLRI